MCTGLFSCMDQRHVVCQKRLSAIGNLLERKRFDRHGISKMLTAADALARVAAPQDRAETTECGHELSEMADKLYEAAVDLFDAPGCESRRERLRERYSRTRRVFDGEIQRLRDSCGPVAALSGMPS